MFEKGSAWPFLLQALGPVGDKFTCQNGHNRDINTILYKRQMISVNPYNLCGTIAIWPFKYTFGMNKYDC